MVTDEQIENKEYSTKNFKEMSNKQIARALEMSIVGVLESVQKLRGEVTIFDFGAKNVFYQFIRELKCRLCIVETPNIEPYTVIAKRPFEQVEGSIFRRRLVLLHWTEKETGQYSTHWLMDDKESDLFFADGEYTSNLAEAFKDFERRG